MKNIWVTTSLGNSLAGPASWLTDLCHHRENHAYKGLTCFNASIPLCPRGSKYSYIIGLKNYVYSLAVGNNQLKLGKSVVLEISLPDKEALKLIFINEQLQ